jgi:glucose-1-phosphate cytidylyltransferase
MTFHGTREEDDWEVVLADTGLESCTATRIRIAAKYLKPKDKQFFLTYGDGVADVNMEQLLENHNRSGRLLTISAVHPEGRFGEVHFRKDGSIRFDEKPIRSNGFINGGFMVVEKSVIKKYIPEDQDLYFEAEPFSRITEDSQMNAYRHEGFWQCMDTPREHTLLNRLWDNGNAPWTRYWKV